MFTHKNQTEALLLNIIKNCTKLIEHTQTKPQETLEFRLTHALETFSFKQTSP